MEAKHKIEYVPIGDLKPAEYNPRRMTEKQAKDLEASMRKFGLVDPIIVNRHPERMNVVIGGHQRLKIAERIGGIDTVPVVYVELDESQEKELNLRLNKNLGEWDFDLLANFEPDMLLNVGWIDDELEGIFQLEMHGGEGGNGDPDAVPDPPAEPKSRPGDLYQLGRHRLLCGDSTKREDVEKLMGGEKADMVFTDPPYGLNWNTDYTRFKVWANNNRKFNHIQNDDKPFDPNRFLEQYKNCLFFGANCFSDKLPLGNWIVWDKRFESGKAWLADGEVAWYTGSGAVYIISETNQGFVCSDKEKYHPTQKPIKLIEKIFEKIKCQNFIFDPFGGSGTTLIACEKTNRRCFMVEIDPSYVDVIISRWEQFTGQTAVKL